MTRIPHRDLRLKALEQERKWLEGNDPDAAPWWKGWETKPLRLNSQAVFKWGSLASRPQFFEDWEYQFVLPPRTVTVYTKTGAVELPEPMREAPEQWTPIFYVSFQGLVEESQWDRHWRGHRLVLDNHNLFHTAEHAQAWADFQRMQRVGETK